LVGPDQWGASTPCSDWNVRDLVKPHRRRGPLDRPVTGRPNIADVGDSLDGDLLGDDPVSVASHAARAAQTSVITPVLRGATVHLSYGEEQAAEYVYQLAADHLVHSWDLAVAIGAPVQLDPQVVDGIATWFKDREDLYRSAGMIGPRLEGFSDPVSVLVGTFGRDPGWTQTVRRWPGSSRPSRREMSTGSWPR